MTKQSLTHEQLNHLFYYKDGTLFWKNPSKYVSRFKDFPITSLDSKGYLRVGINGTRYAVHRIIYFMHYGYLPDYVDHINNEKIDNRIENLRPCSNRENSYNAGLSKANKSGIKGVCWNKSIKKWHVQITVNGKRAVSKYFKCIEEARFYVKNKRILLHGEFSREK